MSTDRLPRTRSSWLALSLNQSTPHERSGRRGRSGSRADEVVEIMGDRSALRQVVDNLLSNVRSHTPAGTTATVTVERRGEDAIIEISDDGPGFTAEQSAHLFERFFRVDSSRARGNGGGSGLGLSIVAAIVAAHGGSVEARPGPSGGATFTVRLPAKEPDLRDDAEPIIATRDA